MLWRSLNLTSLKRRGLSNNKIRELKKAFSYLYLKKMPVKDVIAQLDLLTDNQHIKHLQRFIQLSLDDGPKGLIAGK